METVLGVRFTFKSGDFWQNNPSMVPAMVTYVIGEAGGAVGRSDLPDLIDAYCGSGLFALCAAKHFREVVGVDVSSSAVLCATDNAKENGVVNVNFVAADASRLFDSDVMVELGRREGNHLSTIIDPPREGCDKDFLKQLLKLAPSTIVYVSCHPATQIRDVLALCEDGLYAVTAVRGFDMFPRTRHLESVVTLRRQ
jgi:23S rRNA (uracil1939-C5)-methyltransferase/tRNA (uracil-5-)-methyltransferase